MRDEGSGRLSSPDHVLVRWAADRGLRRRLGGGGAVRLRGPDLLAQLQVSPTAGAALLRRAVPQLSDERRRIAERTGVRDPGPRGNAAAASERLAFPGAGCAFRPRPGRAAAAGGLLLQDVPPPA